MIDLHIHTKHSDGRDSTAKLLEKAGNLHLEMISITDHNSVKAYYEIEKMGSQRLLLYEGIIMVGCEFTTSFEGSLVEVLGYHFDYKKIDTYLKSIYTKDWKRKTENILKERVLQKLDSLGVQYEKNNIKKNLFQRESIFVLLYNEIIKYPENMEKFPPHILDNYQKFYREGLNNPESILYMNPIEFYPPISEVIREIHKAGGIAILAHPYQYRIPNTTLFLDKIFALSKLDGIECFYPSFTNEQMRELVLYCQKYHLLMSGGSDYHGSTQNGPSLGTGFDNLSISKDIILKWTEGPRPSKRRSPYNV